MPIAALIFDCDGTLVDSEEPGLDVLHQVVQRHGLALTREQAHHRFRGVRMALCMAWVAGQLGREGPEFEQQLMTEVRQATTLRFNQGLRALPGAHELLGSLQVPFCVATNGPREKVELTLALSGLRHFLGDRVFCAYEVGSFKPEPGLFLHAAQALGVAPAHCAVVEDSLPGVLAGLAAGMQVFTLHPREGVDTEVAQRITFIQNLAQLGHHLGG